MFVRAMVLQCVLVAGLAAQRAPAVERSGLDHFWRLERLLAAGTQPSDSAWNALWATPGYALLETNERRRKALTMAMQVALDPTRRTAADSIAARGGWLGLVIPHLRAVQAHRDSMQRIERWIAAPATLLRAMDRARAFLPDGTIERYAPPDVSLAYFLDGRGYARLVLDPGHLGDLLDPTEMLGHEFHHNYRRQIARPTTSFGDDVLMWRLETTEEEGIAGLVDKRAVPALDRDELARRYRDPAQRRYFETYQVEYARSNQWLAWADDIYRRSLEHPDSAAALGKQLDTALPDNGRIMGAYMSEVIIAQLGQARLVASVGDPWRFWRTYQEAARRTGGTAYALSEATMRAIDALEKKYAR